ncbi:MAG: endolytic transglycosylase MltG [Clostridia bacterium]|nr:endolytic transglycosylase MltG [Clostridia bacterium]
MANKHDDYSELLKRYGEKKTDTNKQETPKAPNNRMRYSAPPAKNANNGEKSYKGGVYFSNPPRDIDKEAERQKNAANRKGGAVRKASAKKKRPAQSNVENAKPAEGNAFVRFFKSARFKRSLICLVIVAVVSTIICFIGIGCINDVLALKGDETPVEVTVQSGMTDEEVLGILKDKGLIDNKLFCKLFLSVFEQDGDYISGVYTLTEKMGVEKMLAIMKTDYTNSETVSLTFPEGWTVQQMAEKLEANDVCTASSFISTLQTVDFSQEYDFIASIPEKEKRFCVLEGYLYPDTYEFYVGENASSVVRRFLDNFQAKWTEEYQAQAEKRGLTVDEVVIMASVLQKEAANNEQMPTISSVLYNRLEKPNTFPLLQCDSTEDYLLKTIKPTLTSSIEDTQKYIEYRNNYDTYSEECKGLPIGAISNPGDGAIKAALFPEDTGYFYFRHDSEGEVYYASSFAEHERNGRLAASGN